MDIGRELLGQRRIEGGLGLIGGRAQRRLQQRQSLMVEGKGVPLLRQKMTLSVELIDFLIQAEAGTHGDRSFERSDPPVDLVDGTPSFVDPRTQIGNLSIEPFQRWRW